MPTPSASLPTRSTSPLSTSHSPSGQPNHKGLLWVDSGHWDRATDPHLEPRTDIGATLKVRRIRMRPRSSCSETGSPAEETGLRVLTPFQSLFYYAAILP